MNFSGKTILVTGASQGLGRQLAVHFGKRGASLILAARNEANLKETCKAAQQAGGAATYHVLDLCRPDTIETLVGSLGAEGREVDILINNAADVTSKPLLETSLDEIERLIRTNVTGALQLTRGILPVMIRRRQGMIVNISSLAGCKPNPTQTVYSISKTGVNGISAALRAELRGTGVHVMNVALSSVGANPGQVPPDVFSRKLEEAIRKQTPELFLSFVTKWLMRLYAFLPWLARLR